jgi:hypothetical protein
VHAAVRRGGRRGIGPVHGAGAEIVPFCVFPFRSHLVEELFPIVASVCVPQNGESGRLKCSRRSYSATYRRGGSIPL